MRPFLPSFKSVFFGCALALAANGAQAQTVTITGGPGNQLEGNPPGNTPFVFTIAKTPGPTGGTTTVTYTLTGTATAPEDYTALSGTINLTNASPSRTITVNVKRDTKFELDESLTLTLTGASAGYVVAPPACGGCETATILNDDTQPTVRVGWNNVTEGAGAAVVTVTLSNKSYQTVSVDAATTDGTAVAPADYTAVSLTGPPRLYGVNSAGNANGLLYMDPSTGAITGGQVIVGAATVTSAKGLSIDPTTGIAYAILDEGGRFLATLDLATGAATEIGALTPNNFVSLAFNAAGELFGLTGGTSSNGGLYSIDKATALSTPVATLAFGNYGHAIAYRKTDNSFYHWAGDFPVTFEKVLAAPPYTITPIATVPGSEVFGAVWNPLTDQFLLTHYGNSAVDFWSPAGVVSNPQPALGGKVRGMALVIDSVQIPPDSLTATFPVSIVQDTLDEINESFTVSLANPVNATLGSPFTQTRNILDDDNPPTVSISPASASVVEGNVGTQLVMFTATLSVASGRTVTVGTSTTPGAATTPSDYAVLTIPSGVTFNPGETSKVFAASVKGDGVLEPDEAFSVNVVPNGTTSTAGSPTSATVTIVNDDSPALVIDDPVADEDSGTISFTVSITSPAPAPGVSFTYATGPAGLIPATDGVDYTGVPAGSGMIPTGQMVANFSVTLTPDMVAEGHETFAVNLLTVTGTLATILDSQGIGTIANDDLPDPGALVISEFALRGSVNCEGPCNWPEAEFVEIANTTSSPMVIGEPGNTSGSGGFSVAVTTSGGSAYLFTIPNGTTIPARGHFLGASDTVDIFSNPIGYTISDLIDYGGTNAALPDATWGVDLPDNQGLGLFATSSSADYCADTPLDSVGFVGDCFVQGTGLTPLVNPGNFFQGSWVRRHVYGGLALQNTPDSAADFVLVDPFGTDDGFNVAVLGGPSPENLAAETEKTNAELTISLLDPGAGGQFLGDNYQFNPENVGVSPKSIELRRVFTNNTAGSFSALRFKATSLSTLNSNGGGTQADFRPASTVDTVTGSGTAYALTLEAPPFYGTCHSDGCVPSAGFPTDVMGGLNSSLRLNQVPLGAGGSVGVNFRLIYTLSGAPGFFWVTAEAKP